MMHTQTHTLTNRRLSLLAAALVLLLLFIMTVGSAWAEALPTTAGSAHTSTALLVDRTDDTADAQACTDAPNDCSLRGAIIKANQQVSSTIFFQSVANLYRLTIAPDGVNDTTTGDLNITADVYIDGLGGRDRCTPDDCQFPIIQGGVSGDHWLDRIFRVENGATVTLASLDIRHGGHPTLATGGGILVTAQAHLTLLDSRLADHTARRGAGLAVEQGAVILYKSIILDNNLLERSSCTVLGAAVGDIVGQADGDVDTKLGKLHNSGFAVETHALLPGSPAINGGNPDSCLAIDQRGVARPQGGRCDIGAFEAPFYYLPLATR